MYFNTAHAASTGTASSGGIGAFLPFILIAVVFYFLLIRPQSKQKKQHQLMLNSLKAGDKVITTSGIHATIVNIVDANTYILEIASGVSVKISKGAIAKKIGDEAAPVKEKKSKKKTENKDDTDSLKG